MIFYTSASIITGNSCTQAWRITYDLIMSAVIFCLM
jgi:hypothetical protein